MKPVERSEVLGMREYEPIRERFRSHVMEQKKSRRLHAGPNVMVMFENRATVLLQIEEMLRTEQITREEGILHEISTYNELVPGENELSCTLMIAIEDEKERGSFLVRARGFERHVALVVNGKRFAAHWNPTRELEDQTSAVHYLKFPLGQAAADAIRAGDARIEFVIDHPAYAARQDVHDAMRAQLREDLLAP